MVAENRRVNDLHRRLDCLRVETGGAGMKRLFNKDVPFITYIIHDKNMNNGRTVTVYKPTQEYYILFELIKFRRLPSTFPDIGITVISEGLEPSSRSIK